MASAVRLLIPNGLSLLCLVAGSFWLSADRYVGIAPSFYQVATLTAFWAVVGAYNLSMWRKGRAKGLATGLISSLFAILLGELPWRLHSRGMIDSLWTQWGFLHSDVQKAVAQFCLDWQPLVLLLLCAALAREIWLNARVLSAIPRQSF